MNTPRTRKWIVRSAADLGRAMAGARKARHLSQKELASGLDVDRAYLAKLETGATSPLVLDRVFAALRRMGASVVVTLPEEDGSDD